MTDTSAAPKPHGMGRKKKYTEDVMARFTAGTKALMDTVMSPTEDRTDFIREAVAREIARRSKSKGRPK